MPVLRELPSGLDLLTLHRRAPARYPLLMESVAHGTAQGRWDLLLAADGGSLRRDADDVLHDGIDAAADVTKPSSTTLGSFLDALDARWRTAADIEDPLSPDALPLPFRGGWALFLAYELAAEVEPTLRLPRAPGSLPVAIALRCPAAVLRDRATGRCVAVAESDAAGMLDGIAGDIADLGAVAALPDWRAPQRIDEAPPQGFVDGVRRVIEYLRAGDVFQANLSRGWQATFDAALDPAALYARLRTANPAPFAGLFAQPDWAVVSASPERLVSVRGEVVETRPIAGTRPRVAGDDDGSRIRELVGHPKERAEHVMLVDLERNDLGRICVPGSVQVDELMSVESYAHVHHIVSNVRGLRRYGVTPGEVIRAVFPGGTITGCPKVRCMEIIAELEGAGRGAYTGAIGWLDRSGDMDLNILIRSAEVQGDTLRFRTGAGIVADSDPQRELDETRAKARGMLQALAE